MFRYAVACKQYLLLHNYVNYLLWKILLLNRFQIQYNTIIFSDISGRLFVKSLLFIEVILDLAEFGSRVVVLVLLSSQLRLDEVFSLYFSHPPIHADGLALAPRVLKLVMLSCSHTVHETPAILIEAICILPQKEFVAIF